MMIPDPERQAPLHRPWTRPLRRLVAARSFAAFLAISLCAAALLLGTLPLLSQSATSEPDAHERLTHKIAPGETLSEIAKEYGVELETLMILNWIGNADAIDAGQVLRLPQDAEPPSTPEPVETPTTTPIPTTPPPEKTAPEERSTEEPVSVPPVTGEDESEAEIASRPDAAAATTLNRRYTVQLNDTLGDIALRLGISHDALSRLNRLDRNAPLVAGQELLLPATPKDLQVTTPAQITVVESGESLSGIAAEFAVELPALMRANGISNPDSIAIGQELVIPPQPVSADEAALRRVGPPRSGFDYYTVLPGDTLSEIGRAFDTPVLALLEYNGLPDEQTVYAGLELRIPYGSPPLPQRLPPVPVSGTSFMVSLSRQQCWLFHGGQIVRSWTCSTGYGEWISRTGSFNVQTKLEMAKSGAYRLDMPYWLGIYDVGEFENGIHGIPVEWETGEKLWDGLIGQPATFGCAMLADDDAAELFAAAYLGMPVHLIE